MLNAWIQFLIFSAYITQQGTMLVCLQCSRRDLWYSPVDNEQAIARCQYGRFAPTNCFNSTATHCIRSFYRKGLDSELTIIERRCGVLQDIVGCTLYKSPRQIRHIIWNKSSSGQKVVESSFVEVCVDGCSGDECRYSSASKFVCSILMQLLTSMIYGSFMVL